MEIRRIAAVIVVHNNVETESHRQFVNNDKPPLYQCSDPYSRAWVESLLPILVNTCSFTTYRKVTRIMIRFFVVEPRKTSI